MEAHTRRIVPILGWGVLWVGIFWAAWELPGSDLDPDALGPLAVLTALFSAQIVCGVVCLLKGRRIVGVVALVGWLAFPAAVAASIVVFSDQWAPALAGSVLGAAVVAVLAVVAVIGAGRRSRPGSWWAREIERGPR